MAIHIALIGPERHGELTYPLRAAFGLPLDLERVARMQRLPETIHRIAAIDGKGIVGSAGTFRFTMTTPGGSVPTAGVTLVAVLSTHRRRGILTQMMRRQIDESRAAGLPIAALWASESSIYGRFGYGIATFCASVSVERDRSTFRRPVEPHGSFRLVDEREAARAFPLVWERARLDTPGMLSRSEVWWETRRIGDFDKAGPPLQRALLEVDGQPAAYALYRFGAKLGAVGILEGDLSVIEAVGATPAATAAIWRYLCDVDLVRRVNAMCLPASPPLLHLVREPRRLHMTLEDALWVRVVDVGAALAARRWSSDAAWTFELDDTFCPWNAGRWRIEGGSGKVERTDGAVDVGLDAAALASIYLGGVTLRQLADAGDVIERTDGAIERGDALFRWPRPPWCPEIF